MKHLARTSREISRDLTAADIVAACERWVPVNARIDVAIEAHRVSFRNSKVSRELGRTASYALRAVTLARTPIVDDYKQMLDYLTSLPIEAWKGEVIEGYSAQEWRDDTLMAITRSLTWMLER